VKYIWKSHFPDFISTNMMFGNDFFVFKISFTCKQKISKILYFLLKLKYLFGFLCANPLMTSINFYTRKPNSMKLQLRTCFLCFSWCLFFAFWGSEKHVIHNAPFRSTRYVLKCYRYLEVSNLVSNRNKVKNLIFVGSILQICQLELPIFIYKLMCQSSL